LAKLIGRSPTFIKAIEPIPVIARHDATVLITGETGTGKELVARAIHYSSDRGDRPFVCVNCASFPDSLIEDTLFGHEAGAFTDARVRKRGLLAEADKGTLFLDEVEALSGRAQAALLRVLQDGFFHPLGSAQQQRTDTRVIAATNAPLDQLVAAGSFRSDLYHRLRVLCVDLPPLRERQGDILLLASHFLHQHTPAGETRPELDSETRRALTAYAWPGNVRELANTMLRAAVACRGRSITPEHLGVPLHAPMSTMPATFSGATLSGAFSVLKRETIHAFERRYLTDLITQYRGNVTHAARTAGKDRRELGKLLKKHGLDPRAFRAS
jgi:DNA-binding NtrC family response regulator